MKKDKLFDQMFNSPDFLIGWQFEFNGKRYGSYVSKGDTQGFDTKQNKLLIYVEAVSDQMKRTAEDLIAKETKDASKKA